MSSATIRSLAVRASAAMAVAALAACSTETVPTSPSVNLRGPANDVVIGSGANASTAQIRLCKWSDVSGVPYNFTITKVSGPGTLSLSGSQQITPTTPLIDGTGEYLPYRYEGCINILNDGAAGVTTVSITETQQAGVTLGVLTGSGNATTFVTNQAGYNTTVGVSNVQAATVYFKNSGTPEEELDGCTYTQGYWKTHSTAGPAKKADIAWLQETGSASGATRFGGSGAATFPTYTYFGTKTWLQIFNTAPKGDAKVILAHQFMAAYLNVNKNVDPAEINDPTVQTAYNNALAYFNGTYVGTVTDALLKSWAGSLDDFNNGLAGSPHCGDEGQV